MSAQRKCGRDSWRHIGTAESVIVDKISIQFAEAGDELQGFDAVLEYGRPLRALAIAARHAGRALSRRTFSSSTIARLVLRNVEAVEGNGCFRVKIVAVFSYPEFAELLPEVGNKMKEAFVNGAVDALLTSLQCDVPSADGHPSRATSAPMATLANCVGAKLTLSSGPQVTVSPARRAGVSAGPPPEIEGLVSGIDIAMQRALIQQPGVRARSLIDLAMERGFQAIGGMLSGVPVVAKLDQSSALRRYDLQFVTDPRVELRRGMEDLAAQIEEQWGELGRK